MASYTTFTNLNLTPTNFRKDLCLCVCIPEGLKSKVLEHAHDDKCFGLHGGIAKTLMKLQLAKVHWPSQNKDVVNWVQSCKECIEKKPPKPANKAPLQAYNVGQAGIAQHWHIDFYGPLLESYCNKRYILVFCDAMSKYVELVPIKQGTAKEVAQAFVKRILLRHGTPRCITTDTAQNMASRILEATAKLVGTIKTTSSPLHPQSNAVVERKMSMITNALAKYLNGKDQRTWPEYLEFIQFSYNCTPSESLGNLTPHYVFHMRDAVSPMECALVTPDTPVKTVKQFVEETKAKLQETHNFVQTVLQDTHQKNIAQKNKDAKLLEYKVGDQVAMYCPTLKVRKNRCPKWHSPWIADYTVFEIVDKTHVKLLKRSSGKILRRKIHIDRIKKAPPRDNPDKEIITATLDSCEAAIDPAFQDSAPATPTQGDIALIEGAHSMNAMVNTSYQEGPYKIAKILAKRQTPQNTWQFRLSFYTFPESYNTWVDMSDLPSYLQDLVKLAWKKIKTRKSKH